jgi:hypothetical protein
VPVLVCWPLKYVSALVCALTPELSRAEGVGLNELLGGKPTEGDEMFNVHCYLDGKRIGGRLYQYVSRVGDTMRFEGDRYGEVTEVIWCMDEPTVDGQRVNLRVESIAT